MTTLKFMMSIVWMICFSSNVFLSTIFTTIVLGVTEKMLLFIEINRSNHRFNLENRTTTSYYHPPTTKSTRYSLFFSMKYPLLHIIPRINLYLGRQLKSIILWIRLFLLLPSPIQFLGSLLLQCVIRYILRCPIIQLQLTQFIRFYQILQTQSIIPSPILKFINLSQNFYLRSIRLCIFPLQQRSILLFIKCFPNLLRHRMCPIIHSLLFILFLPTFRRQKIILLVIIFPIRQRQIIILSVISRPILDSPKTILLIIFYPNLLTSSILLFNTLCPILQLKIVVLFLVIPRPILTRQGIPLCIILYPIPCIIPCIPMSGVPSIKTFFIRLLPIFNLIQFPNCNLYVRLINLGLQCDLYKFCFCSCTLCPFFYCFVFSLPILFVFSVRLLLCSLLAVLYERIKCRLIYMFVTRIEL